MKKIPLYKFSKHKYGKELLVDVIDTDLMKNNIRKTPDLIMSFYCIIIVTDGEDLLGINGRKQLVKPQMALCARPGEVWEWNPEVKFKGMVFIFEEKFLLSFFNDPLFLDRFAFLQADRPSPFMVMDEELFGRLENLYEEMRKEIKGIRGEERDTHLLRAMLYEVLMLLDRTKMISTEDDKSVVPDKKEGTMSSLRYLNDFVQLVNDNYMKHHEVEFYADQLFITSNYLNKVVRLSLGMSTKQYIQDKLIDEAKRLLKFTTLSVAEIAALLNYENASYFVRHFSKIVGKTPAKCRSHEK